MPHRAIAERRFLLSWILRFQGVAYTFVGLTWLVTETSGRVAGISWLAPFLDFLPAGTTVDFEVGVLWILSGLAVYLGGHFYRRSRKWENFGFAVALGWPILMAVIFLLAFFMGQADQGYVTTISYLTFTASFWGFMFKSPGLCTAPKADSIPVVRTEAPKHE